MGDSKTGNGINAQPDVPPFEFEFHSPDIRVSQELSQYTHEKVINRLAKFSSRVMSVVVHLKDTNGPKGGDGLACHMEVRLAGLEPVNVEEHGSDLRATIDIALDRLDTVVGRHVDKARGHHKDRRTVRDPNLAK